MIKVGDRVEITGWYNPPAPRVQAWVRALTDVKGAQGRLYERVDGSWHWEVVTPPQEAGGATSHTVLAEGDACSPEFATAALAAAAGCPVEPEALARLVVDWRRVDAQRGTR